MVYGMGCGEACNRLWDVARYGAWHGMGYGRAVRYGMVWEMARYGMVGGQFTNSYNMPVSLDRLIQPFP